MKGSTLEVPIILAVVLIIVAITGFMVSGSVGNEKTTMSYSSCKEAATQCLSAKAGSGNASCNFCDTQCKDPITGAVLFAGSGSTLDAVGCCKTGNATGIFEGSSGCAVCTIGHCNGQLVCNSDHNWAVDCTACGGDAACNSEYYCNSSTKSCQLRDIPCRIDSDCQALEGTCVNAYCSSGVCRVRQWQDYSLINMGKRCQNSSLSLRDELGYCFSSSPNNGACLECSYGPQHCNDTTVCSVNICNSGFCDNTADAGMNGKQCEMIGATQGYCECNNGGTKITCSADFTAPVNLVSINGGCFVTDQSVTISGNDGIGSGLKVLYYKVTAAGSPAPALATYNSIPVTSCVNSTAFNVGCSGTCAVDVWYGSEDNAGNRNFAKTSIFNFDRTPPTVPVLIPIAACTNNAQPFSLTWNPSTDTGGDGTISRYNVQIFTGSCGGTLFRSAINTSATAYSVSGLAQGVQYFWRVSATDGVGNTGAWSACSSFTIDRTGPTTVADCSSPVGLNPTFRWTATEQYCAGYKDSTITATTILGSVVFSQTLAGNSYTTAMSAGTYDWCVRSSDNLGNVGADSCCRSTISPPASVRPTIASCTVTNTTSGLLPPGATKCGSMVLEVFNDDADPFSSFLGMIDTLYTPVNTVTTQGDTWGFLDLTKLFPPAAIIGDLMFDSSTQIARWDNYGFEGTSCKAGIINLYTNGTNECIASFDGVRPSDVGPGDCNGVCWNGPVPAPCIDSCHQTCSVECLVPNPLGGCLVSHNVCVDFCKTWPTSVQIGCIGTLGLTPNCETKSSTSFGCTVGCMRDATEHFGYGLCASCPSGLYLNKASMMCDPSASAAALTPCTSQAQCSADQFCSNNATCVPKVPAGQFCARPYGTWTSVEFNLQSTCESGTAQIKYMDNNGEYWCVCN